MEFLLYFFASCFFSNVDFDDLSSKKIKTQNYFQGNKMDKKQIIENTIAFVKKTLKGAECGHDWFHIERVFKNALLIAKDEKVDDFVVTLGLFYMILLMQNSTMVMKL